MAGSEWPLLAAIVFAAFAVQTAAGFGAMLVALALGTHALGVKELVPVIVPLTLVSTGLVLARDRAHVAWPLLGRRVLPCMGAGLVLGAAIFDRASGAALARGAATLVVGAAILEVVRAVRSPNGDRAAARPPAATALLLLGAGVIHGIYAAGGPLLVTALRGLDKRAFRSTLAVVWLVLNAALTARFAIAGADLGRAAALVPFALLGNAAGEWAHGRLDERRFRLAACAVLLLAGGLALGGGPS